jgi:integrase
MSNRKLPEGMTTRPGRRGYYAEFVVVGRRVQKKLGNDFEAARRILRDLRGRAERGEFGLLDNDYPVSQLRMAFLKRCEQELRPRTLDRYRASLDQVLGWLGVVKVRQIETAGVLGFREHRLLQGVSPRTVNHDVTILGAMLRWGVEQGLIGSHPLRGIKPLLHDHPKEGRPLTDDEVHRLLDLSLSPWRDIWYALLVTGMRKDELANLRFSDIDWEGRDLVVRGRHAKNRRERRIPIEDGLWEILKRLRQEASQRSPGTGRTPEIAAKVRTRFSREHVFVTTQNTPLTHRSGLCEAFLRSCKLANIPTKTFDSEGRLVEHVDVHSLRRTLATNAIVHGADPKSVQEILGHRTLDMTMRIYARVKGMPKRQAVARLSYARGVTPPEHLLCLPAEPRQGRTTDEGAVPATSTASRG